MDTKAYFIQSLPLFLSPMIYLFSSLAAAPEISGCLSNWLSETLGRLIHSSYRRTERKLPSAFNSLNWIKLLHKHLFQAFPQNKDALFIIKEVVISLQNLQFCCVIVNVVYFQRVLLTYVAANVSNEFRRIMTKIIFG